MNPSYDSVEDEDGSVGRVLVMLRDLDEKHVAGHNRLRKEIEEREARERSVDEKLAEFERSIIDHTNQLQAVAKRTTDVSTLRFTPAMVVSIVAICASIIGGNFASTAGIRTEQGEMKLELQAIKTALTAQAELDKADAKLQDERYARLADTIKEVKARGEMLDLKVNNLLTRSGR